MGKSSVPKISVLVITYNQENVIRRALDSLISQKDYLYEICINDDCSTDNTWNILQEYEAKYPDLVKPVQNEHNLFIFANEEATWKRPVGDLIYKLSGDDEAPADYFRHVCEFVQLQHLDCEHDRFCIYGDYEQREPSGLSFVFKNDMVLKHDPIKSKLRGLICNRSTCFSINVLRCFVPVSEGRSYAVESAQDIQVQVFSDKNYYIPYLGNIYYSGVGVSVHLNSSSKDALERLNSIDKKTQEFLTINGVKLKTTTIHYRKFLNAYKTYCFTHKKILIFSMLYHYILSLDFSLGMKTFLVDRFLQKIKKQTSQD